MKFNKAYLPFAAAGVLLASACTEEVEYTPAEPAPLTEVYFPTTNPDSQNLSEGQTSFEVTIARADENGEKTYSLTKSVSPEAPFTVPESITFADGEAIKTFKVEFDVNDLEINVDYVLSIQLPGIVNTPYSYGTLDIHMIYLPWKSLGMGLYRDGFMYQIFNGVDILEYEVEFQSHPITPGIYRIVNPYDPEKWPYNIGGYDSSQDHYMILHCEDPDRVYIETFDTGLRYEGVPFNLTSKAGFLIENDQQDQVAKTDYATLKEGVVRFSAEGTLGWQCDAISASVRLLDGFDQFMLVFPGYEKPTEWETIGWADFTDGFYGKYLLGADFVPTPYKVQVQQSQINLSQYRIVDPYNANSGYTVPESVDNYFMIDAENPDCVFWQFTTGSKWLNQDIVLGTEADYNVLAGKASKEDVIDAGIGGTFKDDVFVVSADHTCYFILGKLPMCKYLDCEAKLDIKNMEPWIPADQESKAAKLQLVR